MATEKAPVALTGGAGSEFEDCVAARFMIDLLQSRSSLGAEWGAVRRVTWQARESGWLVRKAEFRLIIVKRRFSCRPCRRPFTEPVDGIRKGYRTTQRYREAVWKAAEEFVDHQV